MSVFLSTLSSKLEFLARESWEDCSFIPLDGARPGLVLASGSF